MWIYNKHCSVKRHFNSSLCICFQGEEVQKTQQQEAVTSQALLRQARPLLLTAMDVNMLYVPTTTPLDCL